MKNFLNFIFVTFSLLASFSVFSATTYYRASHSSGGIDSKPRFATAQEAINSIPPLGAYGAGTPTTSTTTIHVYTTPHNYAFNALIVKSYTTNIECTAPLVLNVSTLTCDNPPPPVCQPPEVLNTAIGSCEPPPCPSGETRDSTGTCKPPKTDEDCKPSGKDSNYGVNVLIPAKTLSICFDGCEYRDAFREFVNGGCTDTQNPFYSSFQPVPPETTSPPCAFSHALVDGAYDKVIGTRIGVSCETNATGGNPDDGINLPPPDFNDPDGDGQENDNNNDGDSECIGESCTGDGAQSEYICSPEGVISNFQCTGASAGCAKQFGLAQQACKPQNCNPLVESCEFSPNDGEGAFSDLDPDIEQAKNDLTDQFNTIKNAIKSKFSFNTTASGQLPCDSVSLGDFGEFKLCVSDYATELEQVGQIILSLGFLLAIFIIMV